MYAMHRGNGSSQPDSGACHHHRHQLPITRRARTQCWRPLASATSARRLAGASTGVCDAALQSKDTTRCCRRNSGWSSPPLTQDSPLHFYSLSILRYHVAAPGRALKRKENLHDLKDQAWTCRDYWARFERFLSLLTRTCDDVYIVTGPLYLPSKTPLGFMMQHPMIGDHTLTKIYLLWFL